MNIYETWLYVAGTGLMFALLFTFEYYSAFIDEYLNFKPFNCVLCFTFWSTTLIYLVVGINPIYAVFSSFIAEFSYRKLVN